MRTCAIHVIWTTYLTWPPGDERGHWSSLFDFYGNLIERGHQLNMPDPVTKAKALEIAKDPEKVLVPNEIAVVEAELEDLFRSDRIVGGIPVYAAAVERTHVHLLLGATTANVSQVVGRIKSKSSSRVLKMERNLGRERTWTSGFWKVFLFDDEGVWAVKGYVEAHNERRGLGPAPYTWISPID